MRSNRGELLVLALFAAGLSCRMEAEAPPAAQVFTDHKFLKADRPTKHLGEDCTEHGASACMEEGAVSFHYKPDPEEGYVCSKPCETTADCPDTWGCLSLYPAPGNSFCAPPADWEPHRTHVSPKNQPRHEAQD